MDQIKVAVLGYGHLGKWHCDKVELLSDAILHSVVERSEAARELAQEKFPKSRFSPLARMRIKRIEQENLLSSESVLQKKYQALQVKEEKVKGSNF